MIKNIKLKNWKSFDDFEFKPENINIIIGANASGKSNFLDALELIQKKASNAGEVEIEKIRGGKNYFNQFNSDNFSIDTIVEIKIDDLEKNFKGAFKIDKTNLLNFDSNYNTLFYSSSDLDLNLDKINHFNSKKEEMENQLKQFQKQNNESVHEKGSPDWLDEMRTLETKIKKFMDEVEKESRMLKRIEEYDILKNKNFNLIKDNLSKIIVIDPIPRLIRGQSSSKENYLKKDCSNLISYVTRHNKKDELEKQLLKYLKKLTEINIKKIEFKTLGENNEYSQLYITEIIHKKETILHSDIISDGTLRFIAVISALFLQEPETILAIEEIDNGIAPSKTKLLFDIIDQLSLENKVDVILTTHNTALMNYISKELFEFVYFAHRKKNGSSTIERLRDFPRISKLMSFGEIGELMENDRILNFANGSDFHGKN